MLSPFLILSFHPQSLVALATHCPGLVTLECAGLSHFTDAGFQVLLDHCCWNLIFVINVIRKDSASPCYNTKPPCYCWQHNNHQDHYNHAQDHYDNDLDHHDNDHGQDHHGNDDGQALVRSCHRLERLDLEECVLLTDTSISQVRSQKLSANISRSAIMPFSPTPPSHKWISILPPFANFSTDTSFTSEYYRHHH